jgi:hypothetical protein
MIMPKTNVVKTYTDSKTRFIKRINLAQQTYNYLNEKENSKEKTERIQAIDDLIELLKDKINITALYLPNMELVISMISENIFRPLPPKARLDKKGGDEIDQEEAQDPHPSWSHIRGVYEVFFLLISNDLCHAKVLKHFITDKFLFQVRYMLLI